MILQEAINQNTLNYFTRTNEKMLTGKIRAVVLEFPGLGGGSCMGGVNEVGEYTAPYGLRCAHENILRAYVFTNPWSWMNDLAVQTTDAVVSAIWERYHLSKDVPLIATGGSMGGCGALLYTRYGKHPVAACAANGPGCDMHQLYKSHCNFTRTILSAVQHYPGTLNEALDALSVIKQVEYMPRIPYYIVHTEMDDVIPVRYHSDIFVPKMRELGHEVIYKIVPDCAHCELPKHEFDELIEWVIQTAQKSTPVNNGGENLSSP